MRPAFLLLAALAACNGRASAPEPPSPASEDALTSETTFVDGPALDKPADLLAWFEGDGRGRLVQIPVVVTRSPLGVGPAHIGTRAEAPGPDAVRLELDDGAMSVSLADRLREHCAAGQPCAVWVEGIWGRTVPMPPSPGDGHAFSVRRLVGPVGDGDAARVRVAAS